jgi:hypothetical protein
MHLLPEPLFVLPTDSLQTRTLAGTDNGRLVLLLLIVKIFNSSTKMLLKQLKCSCQM